MRIEHREHRKSAGWKEWVRAHVFLLIVIPCSVLIVASGVVSALVLVAAKGETTDGAEVPPAPDPEPMVKYFSRLTGLPVVGREALNSPATCMMIENSPQARPQSGLHNAGVVYEAVAEGGITRFMAVFQEGELAELMGPVRSVRLYYAEWAKPYNCAIAHVGGADDALSLVHGAGWRDADQFFNSGAYWRASSAQAPHNVYTNAERMKALNASKGWTNSEFAGLPRAVGGVLPTRSEAPATAINIRISSALYNANYIYDAASNSYLRSHESGGAHMDRDVNGGLTQNAPKVVVAIMVEETRRPYSPYMNTVTTGTGVAHIFQNGEYIAASWTKAAVDSKLELTDSAGMPVVLVPGQVWISAVQNSKPVTWQ